MADGTAIEWTDATWNPVTGCSVVSPGCTNCYAMRLAGTRLKHTPSRAGLTVDGKAGPVWNGQVRLNEQWMDQPLRWRRPRRIFVCAHGDLFAENVPDAWIDRVFAVMAEAHWHTFQVLTKRAGRMRSYLANDNTTGRIGDIQHREHADNCAYTNVACDAPWPLPNVWLGVSAERQQEANDRVPELLATPAAVRFVSAEPLLGPIDFTRLTHRDPETFKWLASGSARLNALTGNYPLEESNRDPHPNRLHWIIVGGESGNDARPMHPAWARSIRDQCQAAGVAFFFKQWGEWAPNIGAVDWEYGREKCVSRIGKKMAGRLLDGVEYNAFPKAPA
jgi:protein gp37